MEEEEEEEEEKEGEEPPLPRMLSMDAAASSNASVNVQSIAANVHHHLFPLRAYQIH
jgi:hypothetical protein